MKRNEILGEHKKGVKAVKYNKKPKDPVADYTKAKEKLKPVKPMEGYNPNSASAEHRRKLDQSHAADLKAKAESPDANERDKQRYQNYLDKKEQMANDYNDRMEREDIEQEALYRRRGSSSAYDRDYRSSVSGMGKHDSLAYQLDGGANDEGWDEEPRQRRYEPAADVPHDVYIDGRKWKTFDSASHARNVARKLEAKGKNVTVKASSTDEATGADMGKITKVDPATKKATLTKPDGTSMEVDSTALKPTPDGKMSMDTPDADELKTGTAVVSTEGMDSAPPTDSTSPIHGGQENVDLRRLRELAGELSEAGEGMSDEYLQQVVNGAPGRHMITPEKAKAELARRAAGGKQKVSEPRDDTGDSAQHVPKDYQTKEPLTKGPDGKWRNSKGEERDGLHGGPVNNGAAMFRSMIPRAPTQESTELTAMLRIAGLR